MTPPRAARRPPRRRALLRRLTGLVVAGALVAAGVAIGEALHDNPRPGGSRTSVRRLRPLPLPPVRETVTVTRPNTARQP